MNGVPSTAGGRVLCGARVYPKELADGRGDRDPLMMVTCRNTAPCVVHRERDLSPAADIPASNPAPGLFDQVNGTGRVVDAEIRGLVMEGHSGLWHQDGPDDAHPREQCTLDGCGWEPTTEPAGQPIDYRPLLADDTQPWSVRSRLTKSLGRPALATRLADALPPLLGAELADRLDTLITQALTEQQAQITQELSDSYYAARARLDADAAAKLKELRNERHRGVSRFS